LLIILCPLARLRRARYVRDRNRFLARILRAEAFVAASVSVPTRLVGEEIEGVVQPLCGAREEVPVSVEREAHRGVSRPGRHLLGIGAGGDYWSATAV
jgi:hypothetical protein